MALRDKLRDRAQPMLDPGEQIQSVFLAQSGPNPSFLFLTYLMMFFSKYWVVAVTDKRIAFLKASAMTPSKPKTLAESYPRDSKVSEPSGKLWTALELGGNRYWVHRRFWNDLRAAATPPAETSPAEASPAETPPAASPPAS
jgi:hypothetical protein